MLFEVRRWPEMPELMRRHVNADMPRDGIDDLDCERCLMLADALFRGEEVFIHIRAQAREDVTAIPSKAAGHIVRNLTDMILPPDLCFLGWNVNEQLASRPIWLPEVVAPAQGTQVLRPQWRGEQDIDRDRNLGLDEANAALLKIVGNFRQQLLGKKIEPGAKAFGLQLPQQGLVLRGKVEMGSSEDCRLYA